MDLKEYPHYLMKELNPCNFFKDLSVNNKQLLFGDEIVVDCDKPFHILGLGKTAPKEVRALLMVLNSLGMEPASVPLVVTKLDHSLVDCGFHIDWVEANHPYVGPLSYRAGEKLMEWVKGIDGDHNLIFCLSGGGSALAESPLPWIPVEEHRRVFEALIQTALPIEDLNFLRRHCSRIKNGGLRTAFKGNGFAQFIVNDIPTNSMGAVASGPGFFEAFSESRFLDIVGCLSEELANPLRSWLLCEQKENWDLCQKKAFARTSLATRHFCVADQVTLLERSKESLLQFDLNKFNTILSSGEFGIGIDEHIVKLKDIDKNHALLSVGEYHLKVTGKGVGGRNMHFVATMAAEIFEDNVLDLTEDQLGSVSILSFGTDGSDGPTTAAGAFINYDRYLVGKEKKIDLKKHLVEFDTYAYFRSVDGLIVTGPGEANLMDVRLIRL